MAVIKAKPEKIVPFFLGMMARDSILPYVTTRVPQNFFNGAANDTVTLRVGGLIPTAVARDYEWRTRTAEIQLDDIGPDGAESGIAVKLDTHLVSATALTDEQMTLDDIDFGREVLQPQVQAVTQRIESRVAAAFEAAPFADTLSFGDGADPLRVVVEAQRLLDSHKVAPREGRIFVVGTNIAAHFLTSDRISRYDSTGQTGTPALRDAIIGRIAGTSILVTTNIDPNAGFYVHPSALVTGNVAPVVPRGVTVGRSGVSANGFAARWIMDYDARYARDRSVVSSFMGITSVNDERDANGHIIADDPATTGVTEAPRNVRGMRLQFTGTPSVLA